VKKCKEDDRSLIFEGEIKIDVDFNVLASITNELHDMNLDNIEYEDIVMFDDGVYNEHYLLALHYVLENVRNDGTYKSNGSFIDFVTKLLVWTYQYIRPTEITQYDQNTVKCFYYGDIEKAEMYFLMLMHYLGIDVIYINPLRDVEFEWKDIETVKYSKITNLGNLLSAVDGIEPYDFNSSITSQLQDTIQNTLFTSTGVYKPWQFIEFDVKPSTMSRTIYDLDSSWEEPAKVREGFEVKEDGYVIIPNLLCQIDGVYDDMNKYKEYVNKFLSSKNTLIETYPEVLNFFGQADKYVLNEERYGLTFARDTPNSFFVDELKRFRFYHWANYRDSLQKVMLNGINRVFQSPIINPSYHISEDDQLKMITDVLTVDDIIAKMMDNFDFAGSIPKMILFMEGNTTIDKHTALCLIYLNQIGFDILIFNPSGSRCLFDFVNSQFIIHTRLDTLSYDTSIQSMKIEEKPIEKKGFFSKLFG
jgi:hypothetical protein